MTGKKQQASRRGATMVELAIVLPVLLLIILGIIEFGRGVMVQQILTNAAREGARQAVLPGMTTLQVEDRVNSYLDNTSVSGASRKVEVRDLNGNRVQVATVAPRSTVVVFVSVPYDQVSFALRRWLGGRTLSASAAMRKEN